MNNAATVAQSMISDAPKATATSAPPTVDAPDETVKRKRGRPKGSTNKTGAGKASTKKAEQIAAMNMASAKALNNIFLGICETFGGEEMSATNEEEKELNEVLANYLEAKGIELSPGMALFGAYAAFVASKVKKPTVKEVIKERASITFGALKSRFQKWKQKRAEKKGTVNAPRTN